MAKRRCKGKTKKGTRCERRGAAWCPQHAGQAPPPDTGRTPKKARGRGGEDWRPGFLEALEMGVTVIQACRRVGVGRSTVYDERERNQTFAEAWDEVIEDTTEEMEREAYRRAVEGWRERGIYNDDGEEVGEVRKFSDTLMIFLLKARRPQTYRDQHYHEHAGAGGGPIGVRLELNAKSRKALGDVLRSRPAASSDE